jgi:MOSC domain-containing protein YiiM
MMGNVLVLFTATNAGDPMEGRDEVVMLAGLGIEGDRYALGRGAYSNVEPRKPRHVTFIAKEAFDAGNTELERLGHEPFTLAQMRRNVVVEGVDLNALVGREFSVGGVRFRGIELATPCQRPAMLARRRHKDFQGAFKDRGGLRAVVLSTGHVRIDDTLSVIDQLAA